MVKLLQPALKTKSIETEIQKQITGTNCSTCLEAKTRSKSAENLSTRPIELYPTSSSESETPTSYAEPQMPCWTPYDSRRRVSSHSPVKPIDLTYTMCSNRSRSCDSLSREEKRCCPLMESLPRVNLNPQSEILLQKLVEVESVGNRITSQLSFLKDYIKHELVAHEFDPIAVAHLELERNRLLDQLDAFELINRDLKAHLYEMNLNQMNCDANLNRTESLMKQIESLEAENHVSSILI